MTTEDEGQAALSVTTSTNLTNPHILNQKSGTHLKTTRANTPGATSPLCTEEPSKRRSRRLIPDLIELLQSGEPRSSRIPLYQPSTITQAAIDAVTVNVYYGGDAATWTPNKYLKFDPANTDKNRCDIERLCTPVVHPTTGETITSYRKLANNEEMRETQTTGVGKEFGNLAQGDNETGTPGIDAIHGMDLEQTRKNPIDRVVTYARIVVDFRPRKQDPHRVCITTERNLITYSDKFRGASCLWNYQDSADGIPVLFLYPGQKVCSRIPGNSLPGTRSVVPGIQSTDSVMESWLPNRCNLACCDYGIMLFYPLKLSFLPLLVAHTSYLTNKFFQFDCRLQANILKL